MSSKSKKLGSSTREVPAQKAQKWYPVHDDAEKKKVCAFDGAAWPGRALLRAESVAGVASNDDPDG